MDISDYPGIKAAAIEIAYDNGMVYRGMPEEVVLQDMEDVLNLYSLDDLILVNNFLENQLSKDQLYNLCCGEEDEAHHILNQFSQPELLEDILEDLFNS